MRVSPEEIPDEEYEQVLQRVATVDVAKDSGVVCRSTATITLRR